MFAVPSSDPPSTPASRRDSREQHPSTTPAGPPPNIDNTAMSFTPAGPPPSSVFGSSAFAQTGSFSNTRSLFAQSGTLNSPSLKAQHANPATKPMFKFAMPSSPPQDSEDEMDEDEQDDYSEEEPGDNSLFGDNHNTANNHHHHNNNNNLMDFNYSSGPGFGATDGPAFGATDGPSFSAINAPAFSAINAPKTNAAPADSQPYDDYEEPRGLKRSRYGEVMGNSFRSSRAMHLEKREPAIPAIAKALAAKSAPLVNEADDCVLRSEMLLSALHASLRTGAGGDLDLLVMRTAQQLGDLWQKHSQTRSLPASIGPKNQNSNMDRANYLASLLLRLHHPFANDQKSKTNAGPFAKSSRYMDLVLQNDAATPVPKALLDWLNTYHNPFPEDLVEVVQHRPAPVAHEKFWDMIYATTLRGDLATAIDLLETADFTMADSAVEDGYDEPGYTGSQLAAVRYVTSRCVDLLRSCPAFADGDWDVKNADWSIFRNRVRRELQDLAAYAEEGSTDRDNPGAGGNVFGSSMFGASRNGMSFSTASRRAESKVPWVIYESLKILYGQLQGLKSEIMISTQDWLEATVLLTVWWDGEDDDVIPGPAGSLSASRRSLRQSQQIRPVDVSPTSAYQRQLTFAFASVTDEPEDTVFGINTLNPLHVGLACICENDVQGVVGILQSWSLPIASALVEMASAGGWLPRAKNQNAGLMDGFDHDDLMVLSHGQDQPSNDFKRDSVLIDYADSLTKKNELKSGDGKLVKEGWDLACRVLSRLESLDTAQRRTGEILSKLALNSSERVDKVLAVCNEIGLPDQVRSIAERYADDLAETSQSYGSALVYYARAHAEQKLRSTIDLLISVCLVQSAACPPQSGLDQQLDSLINDQRVAISQLARVDAEAAQLIANYFSGYATLRRFYELRDEDVDKENADPDSKKSGLRPLARKREAAKALLAVIESAADSIRGGLYDAEVQTVVQVDALMALLCEALPLMNQPKNILNPSHLLVLLRAIEDLQTITPALYDQAEALFKAAIAAYVDSPSHLMSSQDLSKSIMAKSTASLAGGYAMVGSHGSIVSSTGDGGEKVEIMRGWDWRKGAVHVRGRNVKGEEVLRILRTQIAHEMAQAWI
ncbi:hypothetical protein MBLNU459_g3704t2 [Dothideomycetes sp. NU459]